MLVRAGFAPSQAEVDALTGRNASAAVSGLIAPAQRRPPLQPTYAAPDFVAQAQPIPNRLLKSREKQQAQRQQLFRAVERKGEARTLPLEMNPGGRQQTQAEFAGGTAGAGGNQPALRLLGRDGMLRVAEGMAQITFDPGPWLVQYGDHSDRPTTQLRPTMALKADEVLPLDGRTGQHPALKPLLPLWAQGQLGIVQGVGYPEPNLSHFRSIEIWQTASKATEYQPDGWAARGKQAGLAAKGHFTTEGVLIGGSELGALTGARAVSLTNPEAFVNQSRFAQGGDLALAARSQNNLALRNLLKVEGDNNTAASGLRGERYNFSTVFPAGAFGNSVRAAAQVVASQAGKPAASLGGVGGVPVITLTLGSFDTHQNQLGAHVGLLKQLADGLVALQSALTELGAWDRTLVMTFSEFGRRARQNNSTGTDHGGRYGQPPDLTRLDGAQNALYTTDFRQLYSTVARDWWGVSPEAVTRGRFEPVKFLHT